MAKRSVWDMVIELERVLVVASCVGAVVSD